MPDQVFRALRYELSYRAGDPGQRVYVQEDGSAKTVYWDGFQALLRPSGWMPTGLVPRALRLLRKWQVPITVVDNRQRPMEGMPRWSLPEGFKLRPYQSAAVEAAWAAGRGVIDSPPRTGKTVMIVELLRLVTDMTVITSPTVQIAKQTFERCQTLLAHGQGWSGLSNPANDFYLLTGGPPKGRLEQMKANRALVFIGTVDTALAMPESWWDKVACLIVDECFVAGTPIGEVPIERVRVGDWVPSFDETTGKFCAGQVERVFVSKPHALVVVALGGESFVCTPGHPFWTQRGWVPACRLARWDAVMVSSIHGQEYLRMREARCWEGCREVLHGLPQGAERRSGKEVQSPLRLVQEDGHRCGAQDALAGGEVGKGVLFGGMQGPLAVPSFFGADALYEFAAGRDPFSADAQQKPDARSCGAGEGEHDFAGQGLAGGHSSGREWPAASGVSAALGLRARMGDGACSFDREAESELAFLLQSGHREPRADDRHRSGRGISQRAFQEDGRSEKGASANWARVDGITILEPGGDGRFGGRCPDGFVYNLQIRGTATYRVGRIGAVSHNCHHEAAKTYHDLSDMAKNAYFRWGFTGTFYRSDSSQMMALTAAAGQVVKSYGIAEMTEAGVLVPSRVQFWPVELPRNVGAGKFEEAYVRGVVRCDHRNALIAQAARELQEQGRRVLVLVERIEHGERLAQLIPGSVFVQGSDGDRIRQVTSELDAGSLRCVIGSPVVGEGLDIPGADGIIYAKGLKAKVTHTQDVFRVLTGGGGKQDALIIDFADRHNRVLMEHAVERMRNYVSMGCRVEVLDKFRDRGVYQTELGFGL